MINHNSSVPMYLQISRQLSEAIQQGGYNPGDKLPSESTLCQQYDVSRITVRQALNLLIQQDMAKIISFSRVLQQKGLKGHTRIQSFSPEFQDEAAQTRLGKNVSNLNLIGYATHTPVVYYRSFFPPDIGQRMWQAAKDAERSGNAFSTYDLYAGIGVDMFRVEQTIGAVNADSRLAEVLELPRDKALIVLESVYYAADGSALEYKLGYYRSDIYSFHLQRQL